MEAKWSMGNGEREREEIENVNPGKGNRGEFRERESVKGKKRNLI